MPMNLHALIRYRTIDRCLKNPDVQWTWESLAMECEKALNEEMGIDRSLSRRTIMYDIKNMKSGVLGYSAPIRYNREQKSYEYSDPSFSIHKTPMTGKSLEELDQALLILRQFSGQEKMEGISRVITMLEHSMNIQRESDAAPAIKFEQSLNEPGQKWLDTLYHHIKKREALTISYEPFDKEVQHYLVSPYLLKEYNNRWFLFALNHKFESIQNIPLDRIRDVKASLQPFITSDDFDPDMYFDSIIGVTLPDAGETETIDLQVYGKQAKYFITKPLHHSQKILKEKKKSTVFRYELVPNFELESRILSHGELVRVLKPKSLKKRIAKRAKDLHKRYK